MFIDHYKTLTVDRETNTDSIKKTYRKLAFKFHPDKCKLPDAQSRFIEIQEAYEILSDPLKRHYYNILWDNHYKPKEKTKSETIFETKVESDYQQWKNSANKTAVNLSKEKFSNFRDKVFETLGEAATATRNFAQIIFNVAICCTIFAGVFINWSDYQNGNKDSLYGVIICLILSLFIILLLIQYLRNEIRDK